MRSTSFTSAASCKAMDLRPREEQGPHGGRCAVRAVRAVLCTPPRPVGQVTRDTGPRVAYISPPMTRRFTQLALTAATFTYLLIILGAIVRITGSGMGCGDHWPLCNGRLLPPLDVPTIIEYAHRLAAAAVSALVVALAAYAWWLRRGTRDEGRGTSVPGPVALRSDRPTVRPSAGAYVALTLLVVQVLLGAVTVKLSLPPWTVILHLGTAMLLLATLLVIAKRTRLTPGASPGIEQLRFTPGSRPGLVALALGFVTVLFGALTANLGAATACLGFPLCNGAWRRG